MSVLIILNDAPYGTEKTYNGLRIAMQLQKEDTAIQVNVFLMADSVTAALPEQNTPNGYYNIERMLKAVLNKGGKVKACGSCAEARGIKNLKLIEGVEISNMHELGLWTIEAEKVITF